MRRRAARVGGAALGALVTLATLVTGCDAEPRTTAPAPAEPVFREVAAEVGLRFHHFSGATGEFYFPEMAGSGAALFDYDGDGDLDAYLVQGTLLNPEQTVADALIPLPADTPPDNRLFRNELVPSGRLAFTDVTGAARVGHRGHGMGVAVGDFDNDGDPDLYVTNFGPNVFFRNEGDGTFTDITAASGADDPRWSASAAFVDYDHDGDLDLFFTNYVAFTIRDNKRCTSPTGARDYCGPQTYAPVPDRLFRNDGGRFTDVTASAGIDKAFGAGLGVATGDFDGDGRIDIYVANDGDPNQLWLNLGDGRFRDAALISGTAYNEAGVAEAGMGVTAGDFDSDGDEDLFLSHLIHETNTLYVNDGSGAFHDGTTRAGLGYSSLEHTGFGTAWFDHDHDGHLDLFVANGAVYALEELRAATPYPYHEVNQLFRNLGDRRFADVTAEGGPALELREVSRGAAFGDVDNDGDVDILVSNNYGPARLLLNRAGSRGHWLQVRLVGTGSSRDGTGARVAVLRRGRPPLWRRAGTGGSYLSAGDIRVHFGLGGSAELDGVAVEWPGGRREVWRGVAADRPVTLREGSGEPWEGETAPVRPHEP